MEGTVQRKERRNARDRKRSQLKKDTMEAMRQQVAQLELEKQRLERQYPGQFHGAENVNSGNIILVPAPVSSPLFASEARDLTLQDAQKQYLTVLQHIEKLRHENRAMTLHLLERDLFRSAAQNLLDTVDSTPDDSEASDVPASPTPPVSPLGYEDALAYAQRTVVQIISARLESDQMQRLSGASVFGWCDFRCQTGSSVQFSIKKSFVNQCARQLSDRMWALLGDANLLRRILPPGLHVELREVQRVNEDAVVIDRITRDRKSTTDRQPTVRTTYMFARAQPLEMGDSAFVIGMKTIDLPVFKMGLSESERWCDIFYWFYFEDVEFEGERTTSVTFGGSLSYFSEVLARMWLSELVFLAIRWESIAVAPPLLPPAETDRVDG